MDNEKLSAGENLLLAFFLYVNTFTKKNQKN